MANYKRLMANCNVSLHGKLDLNVLASTGDDPISRGIVRRVVLPIIEAQIVPLALLTRANAVMADQLAYLNVGGTIHQPSIRVQAVPQLRYEVLRFFLLGGAPVR